LLDATALVGCIVIWPFVALAFGACALAHGAAGCIPGTRANLRARMDRGWMPEWPVIRRVWSKSRRVYAGPVGPVAEITLPYLMVRRLSQNDSVPSAQLQQAIGPGKPVLSAYCILVLAYRGEKELLCSLPRDVVQSDEEFEWQHGCFADRIRLSDFLRSPPTDPAGPAS
jgi:hypothetical protein